MKGVGNQTLPELCHSQNTNPGNLNGGDRGMSREVDLEANFSPNSLYPVVTLLKHMELFPCVSSQREG